MRGVAIFSSFIKEKVGKRSTISGQKDGWFNKMHIIGIIFEIMVDSGHSLRIDYHNNFDSTRINIFNLKLKEGLL